MCIRHTCAPSAHSNQPEADESSRPDQENQIVTKLRFHPKPALLRFAYQMRNYVFHLTPKDHLNIVQA